MNTQNIEDQILLFILNHWHNNFTGISAISISVKFELEHDNVAKILDGFENRGLGNQRRDVKLYSGAMNSASSEFMKNREIKTSIFFPSRDLLEKDTEKRGLMKMCIPEYKLRLHRGDSQIKLYYFKIEVLKKYFDNPEKYRIFDSVIGGDILTRDEYLRTLSEKEIDELTFPSIRYGKRQLVDGSIAISVIVHDLSELPDKEQKYWNSFEIDSAEFASFDNDFEKFIRRDFGAEFIDEEDPLLLLLCEINKINQLNSSQPLFTNTENPYLFSPVVNSKKSLSDSCSELYKILGPDSLNQKFLCNLLIITLAIRLFNVLLLT